MKAISNVQEAAGQTVTHLDRTPSVGNQPRYQWGFSHRLIADPPSGALAPPFVFLDPAPYTIETLPPAHGFSPTIPHNVLGLSRDRLGLSRLERAGLGVVVGFLALIATLFGLWLQHGKKPHTPDPTDSPRAQRGHAASSK